MISRILILHPDPGPCRRVTQQLGSPEVLVRCFSSGRAGLAHLRESEIDLLLLAPHLLDMSAVEFMAVLEDEGRTTPFAMIGDDLGVSEAVSWMKRGAQDVIPMAQLFDSAIVTRIDQMLAKADSTRQIRQARMHSRKRQELRDLLLDGSQQLMLIYDLTGAMLLCNRAVERKGMDLNSVRLSGRDTWLPPAQLLDGTESIVRREQEWDGLLYEAVWSRVESHILCIAQELGPRRKEERGKRQLERSRILAQKMEALGQIAGHLGHDVSNQLLVIMGYTDMLREYLGESSNELAWVDSIRQATENVGNHVKRLLTFTRGSRITREEIDPVELLNKAIKRVRTDFPLLRVQLSSPTESCKLLADASMLEDAFEAVMRNGAEAMRGDGTLHVNAALSSGGSGEKKSSPTHFQVTVEDEGSGISDDILDRVFDPFFTTRRTEGGHGLGLAMSWGCVRSHNGRISVRSTQGSGSTFTILLPLGSPAENPAGRNLQGHVLLVDDDEVVRGVVRSLLRSLGCRVSSFSNGIAALEWFKQDHDEVDLALVDLRMPGMNGWELLTRLMDQDPEIKALIMTAWADQYEEDGRARKAVLGMLHKPFEIDELYTSISAALASIRQDRREREA
jgi:signal transduction histidine kinase/ActR/RegA family two-component response regulator